MVAKRIDCVVDSVIVPFIMVVLLYNSHFADGLLYVNDLSCHLGSVNELLRGKVPYRDFFHMYAPLSLYIPASVMHLTSPTLQTLQGYFHLCSIATIIITWFLAIQFLQTRPFKYLAGLCLVFETYCVEWSTAWDAMRPGLGYLVLVVLFASENSNRHRIWLFVAGFLCGISILYSTEIGFLAVFASFVYLMAPAVLERTVRSSLTRSLVPFLVGLTACVVPFAIHLLLEHALWDYLTTAFIVPHNYMERFGHPVDRWLPDLVPERLDGISVFRGLRNTKLWLPAITYLGATLYFLVHVGRTRNWDRRSIRVLALVAFGAPLYVSSLRTGMNVQFLSSLAPSIVIGMVFLERLWARSRQTARDGISPSGRSFLPRVVSVAIVLVVVYYLVFNVNFGLLARAMILGVPKVINGLIPWGIQRAVRPAGEELVPLVIPRAGNVRVPAWQAEDIMGVIDYVQSRTELDEPVLAFPDMGIYYFFMSRPSVTRFPVVIWAYISDRYVTEVTNTVKENPPRYVIRAHGSSGVALAAGKKDEWIMPELIGYLDKNYLEEKRFGNTSVWRRATLPRAEP